MSDLVSKTERPDRWSQWLLGRRFGGSEKQRQATLDILYRIRDRVLDHAAIQPGDTVLDTGTGDGLLAFAALDRVGGTGHVIFTDISGDLLTHCQATARALGVADRCQFILASAHDLAPVPADSVDVVTTRSVLIYLPREGKKQAFREFCRVLKAHGRLSIFEPINRFAYPSRGNQFWGYDATPVMPLVAKIQTAYQTTGKAPLTLLDFDERDLVAFAAAAGFRDIHLELRVDFTCHRPPAAWETFAHTAPNPLCPTLTEAMARTLTAAEQTAFVAHLRPLVERGDGVHRLAVADLWASKI